MSFDFSGKRVLAAGASRGIDVLVNNASGFGMGNDEEAWASNLSVDVMAMGRTSQHTPLQ